MNFTIDNYLRHPLRWGTLPKTTKDIKVLGFTYNRSAHTLYPTDRKVFTLYLGSTFKSYSNYPLS